MKLLVNAVQMKAPAQYTIQELGLSITGIRSVRQMPVYRRCKVRIWIFLLSVWYVDQEIMAEMDLPSPGS